LLALRAGSDALQLGGFWPLQNDSRIIRFARRFNGNPLKRAFLGGEKKDAVGVAVNLSPRRVAVPILGRVLLGNSTRQTADCELGPYEALILEWHIEEIKTK
ncbi:MAG: hypothetical protein FWE69_00380, partial [Clostridiales bacterium]|nr:hypothetical protein [Clostridiales bacterium]